MNASLTVENDRIRVTVPAHIAESYLANGERLSHSTKRSPETEARALLLSDAMAKLGNASEARLLSDELKSGLDPLAVEARAREILIAQYLTEHSRYEINEIYMRGSMGRRMSDGMADEWARASAYAKGCLKPYEIGYFCNKVCDLFDKGLPPNVHRRQLVMLQLRGGHNMESADAGAEALAEAALQLSESAEWEADWRGRRGDFGEWQIEVIGELPSQIGLCRVENEPAL